MIELEYWRITKYDPAYRNELGHYMRDEWTDFSCVGHSDGGHLLTPEEYLRTESAYVEAMRLVAECAGADEFEVARLEIIPEHMAEAFDFGGLSGDVPCIGVGAPVRFADLANVGRLLLRDGFWCVLKHPHLEFCFGYDYYMRLRTDLDLSDAFSRVEQLGLLSSPLIRWLFGRYSRAKSELIGLFDCVCSRRVGDLG